MKYSFVVLLVFLLFSCDSTTEMRTIDTGKDYYPVSDGAEWIYAYDSIIYNRQTGIIDTVTGQVREKLVETSQENEVTTYRIERTIRPSTEQAWQANTIWSMTIEEDKLFITEENLPFVRLVFPPDLGVDWDGNAYIDEYQNVQINGDPIQMYINWDYTIAEKLDQMTVEGKTYDDVIVVEEVNSDDGLGLRLMRAAYARGVGLISREAQILDCSNCDPTLPWSVKGDKGFTYSLRLLSN